MSDSPLRSPERLAALARSHLMDSPPEAVFDSLVEVARDLLGGTAALVSLVDDSRQFFKAQVGLGEPWASARQTPLSHSFCQHVVHEGTPLLVENARMDARVQDSLAIDALGVIAYAGVPLIDSGNHVLGALCVVDGQPRQWTEKEIRTLHTLAKAVMSEVTLRQTLARLQEEAAERARAEEERARLAAEVDAAHGRLRAFFDTAPAFVATSRGPRHVYESVNSRYEALVGRDRSQLLGRPLDEALPELLGQGFLHLVDRVYRTGQPFLGTEVPVKLDRQQGRGLEDAFVNFVYQPAFDAQGEVVGIDTFGFDVTEQVQARQRLETLTGQLRGSEEHARELTQQVRSSETHLRLVMDSLPVLVSFVDTGERYGFVNKAYEAWFGIPREELVGRTLCDVIGSAAYAVLSPFVKRALAGELFTFEQHAVPYRLGGSRDVRVAFVPLHDASGRLDGYVAMLQDITTQRRLQLEREGLLWSEAAARAEAEVIRARLAELVANAPLAMGSVRGPRHVFERVNPRYQELTGRGRPLVGRPLAEATPEVVSQGFIHILDTVYRTGEPYRADAVLVQVDREGNGQFGELFMDMLLQPACDRDGQVEGVDIFGFDVTAQVRLRQREEELKRLAEERSSFEQQLIGIVSHDLRNPLAAILFGASLLSRLPGLDERGLRSVLRISSAAERAERMVKDLLDFTQARLGKGIPVHPRPLNVADELEGWVEEARAAFPERNVNIRVDGEGHARVDPDRMAQVVGNLVTNALKYSPPGSVVDVRLREEAAALLFEVHNGGAPIPEAQQARVFQPLERGEGSRDMTHRSVGLGLFIVKHVVEAHGGNIAVTSTADAGTTFSVRLPR